MESAPKIETCNLEDWLRAENHCRRPWKSGMIADDHKNLGHVGKIEMLPIFPICPQPSQIMGDVYDLWFSLVGKIGDAWETAKSPIVWDFPDIWKLGLSVVPTCKFMDQCFVLLEIGLLTHSSLKHLPLTTKNKN